MPILRTNPYSTKAMPAWMLAMTGFLFLVWLGAGYYLIDHPVVIKDLINWVPAAQALKISVEQKKPVLYDFSADWCPPSRKLRHDVFKNREASDWINQNFIPVKILDHPTIFANEAEITELQEKFKIRAFPTLIVWAADDKLQDYVGFSDKNETMRFLQGELAFLATTALAAPATVQTTLVK